MNFLDNQSLFLLCSALGRIEARGKTPSGPDWSWAEGKKKRFEARRGVATPEGTKGWRPSADEKARDAFGLKKADVIPVGAMVGDVAFFPNSGSMSRGEGERRFFGSAALTPGQISSALRKARKI
jgi:hypothetical protein